jgi:hypothetical protein
MEQIPLSETDGRSTEKKIPNFYGTKMFITVFTKSRNWGVSSVRWIQSTPSYPISLRSIVISFSHLRLVSEMVPTLRVLITQFSIITIAIPASTPMVTRGPIEVSNTAWE